MSSVEATDVTYNYKVISLSVDLTGSKLIDEIYYIAAYESPETAFAQYIMPYGNVSRGTTRTHGVKVHTVFGRFRVLKDLRSMTIVNTKSAYSALTDLLLWLGKVSQGSDGLILAYHDNNKGSVIPGILNLIQQYKLSDEFFEIVKGFVNVYDIAAKKTNKPASWASLLRNVLKCDDVKGKQRLLDSAQKRAKLTHDLLAKLLNLDVEREIPSQHILDFMTEKETEFKNLEKRCSMVAKVKSLRPIFLKEMRKGTKERSRAIALRQYLITAETDYDQLLEAYKNDGLRNLLPSSDNKKSKKNINELVELLMVYFNGCSAKSSSPGKENESIENGTKQENESIENGIKPDVDEGVIKRKNSHNFRRKLANAKKQGNKGGPVARSTPLTPLGTQN